jgi:hypothetical protein
VATYEAVARTCSEFADYIDQAHSAVEHELASFLQWSAAIQGVGLVAAFVTGGGSELVAQDAQAGRIAATAAKVGSIIARLIELARGLAETTSAAATRVVEISRNLRGLLGARISVAATGAVRALPGARTAEQAAIRGLTAAEESSARVDRVLSRLRPGRRKPNLEVDTEADVKRVWTDLSQGGQPISSTYRGRMVVLPDGTRVGYRGASSYGGPTVDVFKVDRTHIKIHLP